MVRGLGKQEQYSPIVKVIVIFSFNDIRQDEHLLEHLTYQYPGYHRYLNMCVSDYYIFINPP